MGVQNDGVAGYQDWVDTQFNVQHLSLTALFKELFNSENY